MALTSKQQIAIGRRWSYDRVIQHLPTEDRTLIADALRLAADQYERDAAASTDTPRVAEQFQAQCDRARVIAERVEL